MTLRRPLQPSRHLQAFALLCLLAVLPAGCARLSAAHLQAIPWQDEAFRRVEARFMRFEYTSHTAGQDLEIKGSATPRSDSLPPWADSVENLIVTVYLCDQSGNVLASAESVYPAGRTPASGFAFDLFIPRAPNPSGNYSLAIGYRCMFTASHPPAKEGRGSGGIAGNYVFFASEQAVYAK